MSALTIDGKVLPFQPGETLLAVARHLTEHFADDLRAHAGTGRCPAGICRKAA